VRRVAVLGCGGAGKTTLARAIGASFGLPVVHVDLLQREDGEVLSEAEWWARHDAVLEREAWVLDAMKLRLLDRRLAAADTAIFLDLPRRSCLLGILRRRLRYRGRLVPEDGVVDRVNVDFLRWVWGFRRTTRPEVLELLASHADTTEVVILTSRRAVRAYLSSLPDAPPPDDGLGRS
jgi:adenylate kinase family enzyme